MLYHKILKDFGIFSFNYHIYSAYNIAWDDPLKQWNIAYFQWGPLMMEHINH